MTLPNKYHRKPNSVEEEIDLKRQAKKKIANKEGAVKKWKFKSVKKLEDLNYAKNDEIVETAKLELKLKRVEVSKNSIKFLKKSVIPKKHLHPVSH